MSSHYNKNESTFHYFPQDKRGGGYLIDFKLFIFYLTTSVTKRINKRSNVRLALLLISCLLNSLTGLADSGVKTEVGIKTNLIYDALLSPNLGVEIGLSRNLTLDVNGSINGWKVNDHIWKHWFAQPEVRYWFCDRFCGHFVGAHLHGGQYNLGKISGLSDFLGTHFSRLKDTRYQGWFVGAGIAYGYTWMIGKHWSAEAEIGIGWAYSRYDRFPCTECGTKIENDKAHNYFGPTKLALNLIYVF
ncbi:MAG: DUF3575 domain-containing protein [Muribaculaceae bacterium]|nr:DUF3575 domain-containing protein [Muribaculaceae bacterium]